MSYYDAHNHLQDSRFSGRQAELLQKTESVGIAKMVVNGSCAADWPQVVDCLKLSPSVIPSFGWHPWYLHDLDSQGMNRLEQMLTEFPAAAVGEIGLDRWIIEQPPVIRARYQRDFLTQEPPSLLQQTHAFVAQWRMAVRLRRPITVHCLNAWGPLLEVLRTEDRAPCGFLLHSYGGSAELVPELADRGAYFSFPGYFALDRKLRQREVFRKIPSHRLLVETDAPDQRPPDTLIRYPLVTGNDPTCSLNHPANLPAIYEYLAQWLETDLSELKSQVEENFLRLFQAASPPTSRR